MYKYFTVPCCILSFSLAATDYSFLNEDTFAQQNKIWHFESDYSKIGSADFTTKGFSHSKLLYSEGNASMYFSHFLNQENALTWQLGANYTDINWDKNPRFTGNNYVYGITSLSWISYSIEKWRWVINGGASVDTKTFNFGKSAVYFTTLWGRYQLKDHVGVHVGFFAYYGALNGYVLPILGADFWLSPKWEIRAVFPLDASLNYHITKNLTTSLFATSMGGPYRFPRRAHGGIGDYNDAIFKVYSTSTEWDLTYCLKDTFSIGAGIGYDYGGWIQIADSHNHHKKYYNFDGAPYARASASLTF